MQTFNNTSKNGFGVLFAALLGLCSISAAQAQLTTLVSFNGTDGSWPDAGLTLSADNNTLYGITDNDSVVFSVPVTGGTPTTLASIGSYASPTLVGNTLYDTTQGGGTYGGGEVFSVPVTGGTPTTVASFNGSNGNFPMASLTLVGSTFYGTTSDGGANRNGTVFSVPVTGGTPTVLASFNGSNGASPRASLTLVVGDFPPYGNSFLYGTTAFGGANGDGTVFSVPITGGTPTTLVNFNNSNGRLPLAGLTLVGNTLYGTTYSGGANGVGEVFSVQDTGGPITVLASFNGFNGANPEANLTLVGNTLYGTTQYGGAKDDGTVFSVQDTGGPITTLVNFEGANGALPYAGGLIYYDNTLYGTTLLGGAYGDGTVFALVVPEPSTWALLLGGLCLLVFWRTRQARVS